MTSHRRFLGGLFLGSHAVAEGLLTRRQLESGVFRRVMHNVYVDPSMVDDHRLRARAAALVMPPEAAIGGRSAAAWFGAPFAGLADPVLVIAPRGSTWDGPRGVRVHKTDLRPSEVWTTDDGVRLTTARRTAWDIATIETLPTAVALLDGMLRDSKLDDGPLTERALADEFDARRGRWGSKRAQAVLPLVDGRAMSPPESRVRVACVRAGLPRPVPQFEVWVDGVFLGQVDLAWPEAKLIIEYEGAYHFDELQIRRDDARYERLVAAGWRVIRLSSFDLHDPASVVSRVAEALAESDAVG
ncbi:endonuclease domain-containing protein [Geodermatophilus sp. URMC 64]